MYKFFCLSFLTAFLFAACTNEAYESGDSKYSYLRSDFVEAVTNGNATFVKAQTDDDEIITLNPPLKTRWATTPDSTYRALLYYNNFADRKEIISISQIPVLPLKQDNYDMTAIDPVGFTSAWLAKNRKYLNIELALKTGKTDARVQPLHLLGAAIVSCKRIENGARKYQIQLLHKQNNLPKYYTVRTLVSIPTARFHAKDSIELVVNTYNGSIIKRFEM